MTDNGKIVADFLHAWSRRDPDELASFFAEDAVWEDGGGKRVDARVAGVFEVAGGKITANRDYWNPNAYFPPAPVKKL